MKLKSLLYSLLIVSLASTAYAQVKIGSNPGTIGATSNLEVEATNGNKTSVNKSTGQVTIVDGTQGAGKLLTSDANGGASWQSLQSQFIPKVAFAGRALSEYYFGPNTQFRPKIDAQFAAPGYDAVNKEYTIQEAGFYRVSAGAQFQGTAEAPGASVRVYVAGDNFPATFQQFDNNSTGQYPALSTFWETFLPVGSKVYMFTYSFGSTPQNIRIPAGTAFLTVLKLY